jgi:hypothetical protein
MSDLSQSAGNAGEPHIFEHNGKKYAVSLIDDLVKDAFAKRLFKKAREAEMLCKSDYVIVTVDAKGVKHEDTTEYDRRLDRVNQRFVDGEFDFLTWITEAQEKAKTEEGKRRLRPIMMLLCCLLFKIDETEMTKLFIECEKEITSLVMLIIKESFPQLKKPKDGEPDPNA